MKLIHIPLILALLPLLSTGCSKPKEHSQTPDELAPTPSESALNQVTPTKTATLPPARCTTDADCSAYGLICRSDGYCASDVFETVWRTDAEHPIVTLPTALAKTCQFNLDWGDGSTETFSECPGKDLSHFYNDAGDHHIKIKGTYDGWTMAEKAPSAPLPPKKAHDDIDDMFDDEIDEYNARPKSKVVMEGESPKKQKSADMLIEVVSFGFVGLSELAFYHCDNLEKISAIDIPDAKKMTTMEGAFAFTPKFNDPNIIHWDTSHVTNMNATFMRTEAFNQPIGSWDTSNVTMMDSMFQETKAFNQPIGTWNTSNVTNMMLMFTGSKSFNQPIGSWDMSKVTDMGIMFFEAESFDQDVSEWNLASLTCDEMKLLIFNEKISCEVIKKLMDRNKNLCIEMLTHREDCK